MAHIKRLGFLRHLRAEPNQHILHYRGGAAMRSGPGLAYWFLPLSASLAQVPVEDVETTFVLHERSADFQEITVQVTLIYRVADPPKAAQRVNFSISLDTGVWVEQPLQRLNNLWANWSRHPVRACLIELPVTEIVRSGANQTREALRQSLLANPAVAEMGLGLVSVQVDRVAPTPEVEGALQTPARERIQQKADEATFQRRALAVEKERAIKENEMATELMLRQRREDLVRQEGANELLAVKLETQRQRAIAEGAAERAVLKAQGQAEAERIVAGAEAEQRRRLLAIENEAEARRVEIWHGVPASVTLGLAARRFADKVDAINHLNLAPDLLGQALQRLLLEDVAAGGDGMGVADASTAGVDGGE